MSYQLIELSDNLQELESYDLDSFQEATPIKDNFSNFSLRKKCISVGMGAFLLFCSSGFSPQIPFTYSIPKYSDESLKEIESKSDIYTELFEDYCQLNEPDLCSFINFEIEDDIEKEFISSYTKTIKPYFQNIHKLFSI